jgi:hypothetical protein
MDDLAHLLIWTISYKRASSDCSMRPPNTTPQSKSFSPLTAQHQLDRWRGIRLGRFRFHQRELDRRALLPQPLPPSVERMLRQASSATVCADRLAARFLLCDSLAPQLAPLLCFVHPPTMPGWRRFRQWRSCDGYH